jgi:hypothetical protein
MHTFNNNCSAPDDEVTDTPPLLSSTGDCQQLGPFCSGITIVNDENYMDYSPCPSMFTEGQKTRVFVALNSSVGYRNNLWSSANLYDVGCQSLTAIENERLNKKKVIKITDVLGRETKESKNTPLFYIYDDGTVEKKIILE